MATDAGGGGGMRRRVAGEDRAAAGGERSPSGRTAGIGLSAKAREEPIWMAEMGPTLAIQWMRFILCVRYYTPSLTK